MASKGIAMDAGGVAPEKKEMLGRLLLFACMSTCLLSTGLLMGGFRLMYQYGKDEIPGGVVAKTNWCKGGTELWFEHRKRSAFFPSSVTFLRQPPLEVVPGVYVRKDKGSFVYFVNHFPVSTKHELMMRSYPIATKSGWIKLPRSR